MKKLIRFLIVNTICFTLVFTASAQEKNWKLGVQMWTFHISSFEKAIQRTDSAGLKYVEVYPGQRLYENSTNYIDPAMPESDCKAMQKMLDEKGISIGAYGVLLCETEAEWKLNFDFAKKMHIPIITAEPKTEHLDVVNKLAKEYNIKVAIHDHPRPSLYWHPDSVYAAIKNRPYIGVCADLGHWVRNGLNVMDCLKKLSGRIMVLHFKDVIRPEDVKLISGEKGSADIKASASNSESVSISHSNPEEYIDVRLGQGVCEISSVLKELKKQKFAGLFSMEHETNWENNVTDLLYNKAFYYRELKKLSAK